MQLALSFEKGRLVLKLFCRFSTSALAHGWYGIGWRSAVERVLGVSSGRFGSRVAENFSLNHTPDKLPGPLGVLAAAAGLFTVAAADA